MKEHDHCTAGVRPETSEKGQVVSIYVAHNHPLLPLKRALPWEALFEVMGRRWREAGKNLDGRPGLPWDVSLYVPLLVLLVVKGLNPREMEAYLAENVVGPLVIPTSRASCGDGRSAVGAPWQSSQVVGCWGWGLPWSRCRRFSGRSKNIISLPRAKQKSSSS